MAWPQRSDPRVVHELGSMVVSIENKEAGGARSQGLKHNEQGVDDENNVEMDSSQPAIVDANIGYKAPRNQAMGTQHTDTILEKYKPIERIFCNIGTIHGGCRNTCAFLE